LAAGKAFRIGRQGSHNGRIEGALPMTTEHPAGWLELKIPPPVVALLAAAGAWGLARAFPEWHLAHAMRVPVAILLAAAGVALAASGIVAFRRVRTTINPHKPVEATALVSSGPYRFTRNPMYMGMLLVLLAWTAFLSSPPALAGPLAFVLYMNRFQIGPEERALRSLFGSEYTAYVSRVRRWL
jgi:protein-S-isoprenylcysteine O-methyltransferase Ste14